MGNDNSILIVVLVAVAYLFFIQPSTGAKPKAGERYCPKGERYPATQWELLFGCREGYDRKLFGDDCVCTAPIPSGTIAPQTPAPTIQKCPWNSNLLAGDIRCQNPTQSTVIIGQPEPGYTECIVGAPVWDGGCP